MKNFNFLFVRLVLFGFVLFGITVVGCKESATTASNGKSGTQTGGNNEGQSHQHDHPAHGPHGGHLFEFGDYHGEWLHYNDNDIIRVHILDADAKKNVYVKADKLTIKRVAGSGDDAEFTLDPEEPNENGEATVFSLDNKDLTIAMNLGVTIEMQVGDKTYTANIDAHEPHDH